MEKISLRTKEYEKQRYGRRREVVLARVAAWQKKNRLRANENKRRHYWKDIEKSRRQGREWQREFSSTPVGKLIMRARNISNRHRTHDVVFLADLRKVFEENSKKFGSLFCERCGIYLGPQNSFNGTIDHVRPLSRGGDNGKNNLQILCLSCNSRKHVTTYDYRQKNAWLS